MNYGIIQNHRHDAKRDGVNNNGARSLLQDGRLREMARQMGLDAKDFGHEAAQSLWQLLDDMATNDPGAYQKFIQEQLKDGPPVASTQQQQQQQQQQPPGSAGDDKNGLASTAVADNQSSHDAAKSPVVLLPRYFAPYPGFVVKCAMFHSVKCQQQETKLFLNCCAHETVDMPKNPNSGKNVPDDTRAVPSTSNLEIPLAVGKLRELQDGSSSVCVACDVVFHPWVMRRCEWDAAFKREVLKLAVHWVQQDARVRLVNPTGKFIKSRYKGGSVVDGSADIATAKFLVDPTGNSKASSASASGDNGSASNNQNEAASDSAPSVIESPSELLKRIHLNRKDASSEREFLIKPASEAPQKAAAAASPAASSTQSRSGKAPPKTKLIQELDSSSPSTISSNSAAQPPTTTKPNLQQQQQPLTAKKSTVVKKGFLLSGAAKTKTPLYPTGSSEGRAPSPYVNLLSRSKVVDLGDVERQKKQQQEERRKLKDEFAFLDPPSSSSSSKAAVSSTSAEVDCGDFEFEQLCMDADPDLKPAQHLQDDGGSSANDPARQLFGDDFVQISKFLTM